MNGWRKLVIWYIGLASLFSALGVYYAIGRNRIMASIEIAFSVFFGLAAITITFFESNK